MSLKTKTVSDKILFELCKKTLELFEVFMIKYVQQKKITPEELARIKVIIADLNRFAEVLP